MNGLLSIPPGKEPPGVFPGDGSGASFTLRPPNFVLIFIDTLRNIACVGFSIGRGFDSLLGCTAETYIHYMHSGIPRGGELSG